MNTIISPEVTTPSSIVDTQEESTPLVVKAPSISASEKPIGIYKTKYKFIPNEDIKKCFKDDKVNAKYFSPSRIFAYLNSSNTATTHITTDNHFYSDRACDGCKGQTIFCLDKGSKSSLVNEKLLKCSDKACKSTFTIEEALKLQNYTIDNSSSKASENTRSKGGKRLFIEAPTNTPPSLDEQSSGQTENRKNDNAYIHERANEKSTYRIHSIRFT